MTSDPKTIVSHPERALSLVKLLPGEVRAADLRFNWDSAPLVIFLGSSHFGTRHWHGRV